MVDGGPIEEERGAEPADTTRIEGTEGQAEEKSTENNPFRNEWMEGEDVRREVSTTVERILTKPMRPETEASEADKTRERLARELQQEFGESQLSLLVAAEVRRRFPDAKNKNEDALKVISEINSGLEDRARRERGYGYLQESRLQSEINLSRADLACLILDRGTQEGKMHGFQHLLNILGRVKFLESVSERDFEKSRFIIYGGFSIFEIKAGHYNIQSNLSNQDLALYLPLITDAIAYEKAQDKLNYKLSQQVDDLPEGVFDPQTGSYEKSRASGDLARRRPELIPGRLDPGNRGLTAGDFLSMGARADKPPVNNILFASLEQSGIRVDGQRGAWISPESKLAANIEKIYPDLNLPMEPKSQEETFESRVEYHLSRLEKASNAVREIQSQEEEERKIRDARGKIDKGLR